MSKFGCLTLGRMHLSWSFVRDLLVEEADYCDDCG